MAIQAITMVIPVYVATMSVHACSSENIRNESFRHSLVLENHSGESILFIAKCELKILNIKLRSQFKTDQNLNYNSIT